LGISKQPLKTDNNIRSLPPPSTKLKQLLDEQLKLPIYEGLDEDISMFDALRAILQTYGQNVFELLNTTDQTLLRLAQAQDE